VADLKCFGCSRTLEVGDRYIEDTASGFGEMENGSAEVDGLIAELFGGRDGKVVFCEDCTTHTPDGRYQFETVHGDEDEACAS
jgi:hypothetical protein